LTTLLGLHPRFHQNTRQDTDPISPAKPDTDADEDRIISLLIQDSLSDLESLKQYQEQEDLSKLSFTCHRLAGRIGQFGQDKLAFKLRKIEIDSRNGDATSPADFQRVVQEVETFIQEMNTSRPATT